MVHKGQVGSEANMDKKYFYELMGAMGKSDYENYLQTADLFACQKSFSELCNQDELQFQIVHQIEELLLRLVNYTLLDVDECFGQHHTFKAITLFKRVHILQKNMLEMIDALETMSPKDYQLIRLRLGSGSGLNSPGFTVFNKIHQPLWESYKQYYLVQRQLTLQVIYEKNYDHNESYLLAECMIELDELHMRFFQRHLDLIGRTIGKEATSLRGNAIDYLQKKAHTPLFPELWSIRSEMSDTWGHEYGFKRPSLGKEEK